MANRAVTSHRALHARHWEALVMAPGTSSGPWGSWLGTACFVHLLVALLVGRCAVTPKSPPSPSPPPTEYQIDVMTTPPLAPTTPQTPPSPVHALPQQPQSFSGGTRSATAPTMRPSTRAEGGHQGDDDVGAGQPRLVSAQTGRLDDFSEGSGQPRIVSASSRSRGDEGAASA
jgi:hypothetical protein